MYSNIAAMLLGVQSKYWTENIWNCVQDWCNEHEWTKQMFDFIKCCPSENILPPNKHGASMAVHQMYFFHGSADKVCRRVLLNMTGSGKCAWCNKQNHRKYNQINMMEKKLIRWEKERRKWFAFDERKKRVSVCVCVCKRVQSKERSRKRCGRRCRRETFHCTIFIEYLFSGCNILVLVSHYKRCKV